MGRWHNEPYLTDHRENSTEEQPRAPASQGKKSRSASSSKRRTEAGKEAKLENHSQEQK